MRRLLLLLIMLGVAGQAGGADFSNHCIRPDKGSYVGDGMGDTREGGETFASALVISGLPYNDTGATCDNADDITLPCAASAAPDVVYSYVAEAGMTGINVTLCGSGYDTALGVYDENQVNIACIDDFCGLQSEIDQIPVTAGQTYYIVIDGFVSNCGSYVLSVTEYAQPPCCACPAGAQLESEPDCYDGYYDGYNGGCNSPGSPGWQPLLPECDQLTLCGKSGTYNYNGLSYRDTDWFEAEAIGGQVCATWTAAFPVQAILIYGLDCQALQYDFATAPPNTPVTLCRNFAEGQILWLWAGPSQFTGVPCGSDYVISVEGIACIPPPPIPIQTTSWGQLKALYR